MIAREERRKTNGQEGDDRNSTYGRNGVDGEEEVMMMKPKAEDDGDANGEKMS